MEYKQNEQLKLAAEYVRDTGAHIFLTGKAGTGKTTFLKQLGEITTKRRVVLAPTGVAALHAGGMTIHSFFQLEFGPHIPGSAAQPPEAAHGARVRPRMNREKLRLIRSLDLLVIDEISMVRADVLDAVDEALRGIRGNGAPFGGVQLLMIGDLYQLSPVVRDSDRMILRDHYSGFFFFESHAIRKSGMITIELKEIFRQTDPGFIALLNKVRESSLEGETIRHLNERYIPGFKAYGDDSDAANGADRGYITLTTHNAAAATINTERMAALPFPPMVFEASVEGDFPPQNFPNEAFLELKTGAQVMFIRNNSAAENPYFNGKIGRVTRMEEERVWVQCPGEARETEAGPVQWENIRYTLDRKTGAIAQEIAGTFTQLPLKPAWAITIHKSQGLTFDRVVIDAQAAFAAGQVYVALSRCRTFGGIVLSTPLNRSGIITDSAVLSHSSEARRREPGREELRAAKVAFQRTMLLNLFDFKPMTRQLNRLLRLTAENERVLEPAWTEGLRKLSADFAESVATVGDKFRPQLSALLQQDVLPEENTLLQERVRSAAGYFTPRMADGFCAVLQNMEPECDNSAVRKQLSDTLERLLRDGTVRLACLNSCQGGYMPGSVLRAGSEAEAGFGQRTKRPGRIPPGIPGGTMSAGLLEALRGWRSAKADETMRTLSNVLPLRTMLAIAQAGPRTLPELEAVKGMGAARMKRYGKEILRVIAQYNNRKPSMSAENAKQDTL